MKNVYQCRTSVTLLRPWPFGPPLRGRAPQHDAGTLAGPKAEHHAQQSVAAPASAPGWRPGLASTDRLCFMKIISTNNKKVSNGNQDVTSWYRLTPAIRKAGVNAVGNTV